MSNVFEARADTTKNRLYIRISGYFTDEEAESAANKAIAEITKLKSGFTVISDYRGLKPTTPKGTEQLFRAMEFMNKHGQRRGIQVVSEEEAVAKMQLDRMNAKAGFTNKQENIASSVAEAEQILDRLFPNG